MEDSKARTEDMEEHFANWKTRDLACIKQVGIINICHTIELGTVFKLPCGGSQKVHSLYFCLEVVTS